MNSWKWLFFIAILGMAYLVVLDINKAEAIVSLQKQKQSLSTQLADAQKASTSPVCSALQNPYELTDLETNHPDDLANLVNACK